MLRHRGELRERMKIPVFHDDQHGTAIVCAAAIRNGLVLQGKTLAEVKLVTSGAGAAALACVDLLVAMGLPVGERHPDRHQGRGTSPGATSMAPNMARYARETDARTLGEVLAGADVFLGLSAPNVLKPEWLPQMAAKPLILALANPDPEILPEAGQGGAARRHHRHRPQRLCEPGQQCPVLPLRLPRRAGRGRHHHQRGDEGGGGGGHRRAGPGRGERGGGRGLWRRARRLFGPDYIIPKPFDPRLILHIAPAVARAAMESGVARRPIADFDAYQRELEKFVYRSGQLMRPVFEVARQAPRRVVYAEGEEERVLRAVQTVVDEGLAQPDPDRPRASVIEEGPRAGPAAGFRQARCGSWTRAGPRGLRRRC